jgi:hypothetical protein
MTAKVRKIPRVFISHATADKPIARRIARRLCEVGAEAVLDEMHFKPGEILPESIREAIRNSTHATVIWTRSTSSSLWVRDELNFIKEIGTKGPVLIPLFFIPPEPGEPISNSLGIDFQTKEFERSLRTLFKQIFDGDWREPTIEQLYVDFFATLAETPAIRKIFKNPVENRWNQMQQASELIDTKAFFDSPERKRALQELQSIFESIWRPEGISVRDLPNGNDPDFHALDFALWAATQITLAKRVQLRPLLPLELGKYPAIFGKVLGSTGAGFEAILTILTSYPGLSNNVTCELIQPEATSTELLPLVVALFERVFAICRDDSGRDQFTPYASAYYFLRRNGDRLSTLEKERFFRMIEEHEEGPYPGGPLDILSALSLDSHFSLVAVRKVQFWAETGKFDACDAQRRSENPRLFYGFAANMPSSLEHGKGKLLQTARLRIKKLFRSGDPERFSCALRWIADSDRLAIEDRLAIKNAYLEGVFSSEFESTPSSEVVAPLAQLLLDNVLSSEHTDEGVKQHIRRCLKEGGLSDYLP